MNFKLAVSTNNPASGAVIIAELINSANKGNIEILWCGNWNENGNVKLTDGSGKLIAERTEEVCRYFARALDVDLYGNTNACERTEVDHWLSFAIGSLKSTLKESALLYLDRALITNTWLVAKKLTIADICIFSALLDNKFLETYGKQYTNVARWYKQMQSLSAVDKALSAIANNATAPQGKAEAKTVKQASTRKQEGKFIDLPGAEMNKVIVRFPPEASGYLHIGHAKAALLNQYYAEAFQGQLIMRFDDTNPAKENVEFEDAILHDLELLQIKPDRFTRSSDYFDIMLEYCTRLIKEGNAYVDDTPAEIMKEQREQRLMSANRNNSVEKNLELWKEMQEGTKKGEECCVRAKIDYQSTNGCLRDPTIYRCKPEPHPRTGTKYKVYPTYDFACPIVDAIENVTHTLRTTEYHDRDAQFYWIIDALKLRRPYIWEYSRLNMTNTVLSKRKLTWFVEQGLVDGWDDPRFPTVRGILRRGMTVEGLKQFIIAQGSSRSVVFMEWDKIWAFNKKVIDPIAHRYTALNYNETVPVHVTNAKEDWLTVQNHPKDPSKGTKRVRVNSVVLIEKTDAEALAEGQNTTFINWGNLLIEKIERSNGTVTKVHARLNLDDKNYKNTLKITWLASASRNVNDVQQNDSIPCYCVYFDHIISKPVLGKDDDFKDFVAKDTRKEVQMLGETELKRVKTGEIIQLQRKGFFRCDVPYAPASPYSSREQPLILFHVPDGHATTSGAVVTANTTEKSAPLASTKSNKNGADNAAALNEKILAQGDKVRRLKAEKADKAIIDAEVKTLLDLKTEYEANTGMKWKPEVTRKTESIDKTVNNATQKLSNQIIDKLKKLKELQALLQQEEQQVSNLQAEYERATGKQWKGHQESDEKEDSLKVDEIVKQIEIQGDKVRQLKSSKADKSIIDQEVKTLLALKSDYRTLTGQEWKPSKENTKCIKKANETTKSNKTENKETETKKANETAKSNQAENKDELSNQIQKQGEKVRQLKSSGTGKDIIDKEVKILLDLKSQYKAMTGQDWKPTQSNTNHVAKKETVPKKDVKEPAEAISDEIQKQGDKVRELKSSKASKDIIDKEVQILLSLKSDYKTITGSDWKPAKTEVSSKKDKNSGSCQVAKQPNKKATDGGTVKDTEGLKTGTRLGLEAKKNENFFDWYSQVITKSGMIEYYDVSGCYILRPWSFAIWKIIKDYIDREIAKLGVQECYFPIFVTRSVLEKEKTHIADFAPEVAWVTKCGESSLAEPIAIRPTSETVMYPAYAKWLRSDTELPLRLNQWNNVVRWEFKDPKPFLRTREFLWQEGHTAFATKTEADAEVLIILDMYARVYEELLAVPVIKGRKTEKEKFAGGDYTTTVEAFIPTSGRAIQGATSHHLGQNFSKMFSIQVEGATESDEKSFVYQNSWGLTTRTIGVMIMVHGDDKGLVLPPRVASIQAVLVPCGITASTTDKQRESLFMECTKLIAELEEDPSLRIKADHRANRTPGWKFNHWELKGVPVRIELGPKDLEKNQVTFVRRDTGERIVVSRATARVCLQQLLDNIQLNMLDRARKIMMEHVKQVNDWDNFCPELNNKNLILAPFCGEISCEDNIKAHSAREDTGEELGALSMGAKSLCVPFEQPTSSVPIENLKCIHPDCRNKPKFYTLFGRSY